MMMDCVGFPYHTCLLHAKLARKSCWGFFKMFALFKMGGARPSNGAKANHFILEVYTVIGV
jgi:hypothetical protein